MTDPANEEMLPRMTTPPERDLNLRKPTPGEVQRRAQEVKYMAKKAWDAYVKFAQTTSRKEPAKGWFGRDQDRNVISSMSTLWVMGLKEEFEKGTLWVQQRFDALSIPDELIVSQVIGDHIGGLLSCFALTGNTLFLNKARLIAELLETAYVRVSYFWNYQPIDVLTCYYLQDKGNKNAKPNGLPYWKCSLKDGTVSGEQVPLSNVVYGALEYNYLSDITGDIEFKQRITSARASLAELDRQWGIPLDTIDITQNIFWSDKLHLFSQTRDYYYDLLRSHIQSGGTDRKSMDLYKQEVDLVIKKKLFTTGTSGLMYARQYEASLDKFDDFMEYEGLYLGAMLGLSSKAIQDAICEDSIDTMDEDYERIRAYWHLAEELTIMGLEAHSRAQNQLAPKRFFFTHNVDCKNTLKGHLFKQFLML